MTKIKKSIFPALLLTMLVILTQTQLNAQESIYRPTKYEIAMDLKGFFSDGYPEKVLFKINNINNNNQINGAYRFGVNMHYNKLTYDVTQDGANYYETSNLNSTGLGILMGYELQKTIKNAVIYCGVDFGTSFSSADEKHEEQPGDSKSYGISLTPFLGVKVFLSNSVALAFETGLENDYYFHNYQSGNDPNNKIKFQSFGSGLQIPYSFSFNFNF
jgi:hypothetical protein